jgi:RimJ/RimL family protein N-acetyltransferase
MSDLCPYLETPRVSLHPLKRQHARVLFGLLRDPELWRYTDRDPPASLREIENRFSRLERRTSDDGEHHWLNWAIEERASAQLVGFVQATVAASLADAEIAFMLGRSAWGRGLATASVGAMLAFLKVRGVGVLRATADGDNARSVRLLERLDFRPSDKTDTHAISFVRPVSRPTDDL